MDTDGLRQKERAKLVAQHEEAKSSRRETVAGWAARYPQIEAGLWQHYEQYCRDLDASLTRFDKGARSDPDTTAEGEKRHAWELLTLLGSVEPELPIASMHDEICAEIDQVVAAGKAQSRAINDATPQAKAAMGDTTIDYHLARPKDETAE